MRHPRVTAVVLFGLLTAATVHAADAIDPSPLLTDQTMWVVRVDLTKMNLPAALDWARATMHDAKVPDDLAKLVTHTGAPEPAIIQKSIDALVKAGVTQAVLVMNLPVEPHGMPRMLIAIAPPADPDAVTAVMKPLHMVSADLTPPAPAQPITVWTFDAGPTDSYLATLTPVTRPELTSALAGNDTATVLAALAVSEAAAPLIRAAPNTYMPPLPDALSPVGNVKRYTLQVDAGAAPHVKLTAETKSADAVTALWKQGPKMLSDIIDAIQPTVTGQDVSVELDQAKFTRLASAAVPALQIAKKQSERVQSMSNMRQLILGTLMYATDNHGTVAPSLDAAHVYLNANQKGLAASGQPAGDVPPELLTNPQHPELGMKGYIYVPPKEGKLAGIKQASDRLMLYEAGDFGDGVSVGFADGHVEFINNADHFKQLLADAGAPPQIP